METVWVESHPECSVCLQPCLHPVQTPCLHIFCFLCLKGFVYRSRKCALCRSEVKLEYFENPVIVKVKSGEAQSAAGAVTESFNWFYEGRNGWWEYDERACATLEEAFNNDECRSCELLISGFTYFIDFEDMVQFRKSHPARRRRIKRDRVGVERKGVAGLKLKTKTVVEEAKEDLINKKDTTGDGDKLLLTKSAEPTNNSLYRSVNENNRESEMTRESSQDLPLQVNSRELPRASSRELPQGSSGELPPQNITTRDSHQEATGESPIETNSSTSRSIEDNLAELLNRTL